MQESNLVSQTIAAVATAVAPGQGGIAVIRLSGPDAQCAVREITSFPGAQPWESHRVLYGHVMAADGLERLDEVLVLLMQAPRSFTAEDVVEIHCHGGGACDCKKLIYARTYQVYLK